MIHQFVSKLWMVACVIAICFAVSTIAISQEAETLVSSDDVAQNEMVFALPVPAMIQTQAGRVIRAQIYAMSDAGVRYEPQNTIASTPNGIRLAWDEIKILSIPDQGMKFDTSKTVEQFLQEIAGRQELAIMHQQISPPDNATSPENPTTIPGVASPDQIHESPLDSDTAIETESNQTIHSLFGETTTVTVTCSNCQQEVSGSSNSGQTCPHCGILWDQNPFVPEVASFSELAQLSEEQGDGAGERRQGQMPQGPRLIAPTKLDAPVSLPPPVNHSTGPQEVTLENLPTWIKASIFLITLGGLYYYFFYLR